MTTRLSIASNRWRTRSVCCCYLAPHNKGASEQQRSQPRFKGGAQPGKEAGKGAGMGTPSLLLEVGEGQGSGRAVLGRHGRAGAEGGVGVPVAVEKLEIGRRLRKSRPWGRSWRGAMDGHGREQRGLAASRPRAGRRLGEGAVAPWCRSSAMDGKRPRHGGCSCCGEPERRMAS